MDIYEPAEDSYLLQKEVQKYAEGRVLDVGTGQGIQGLTAITSPRVREVLSIDINEDAVEKLQEKIEAQKLRKIKVSQSNLFENVTGKFNTIIFNPPYLPQDEGIEDIALYGGKKGWEISEQFFHKVSSYLISNGKILFLFSTLTHKEKIEELITHHLLQFKELSSEKIPFETLYVYEITKTDLLRELEVKRVEELHFLAQGKRGVIYKGIQQKAELVKTHFAKQEIIQVAVKTKREDSQAMGRIENEANWLKKLNQKGIGPKLLFSAELYFAYKFVEGILILDWIQDATKEEVLDVFKDLLNQCFTMDQLQVNKEEMHHPQKHIFITKGNKPVMIDFERCNHTDKPKNVTQFVEFIARMKEELRKKGINVDQDQLRELSKEYKQNPNKASLETIINNLSS